MEAAGAAAYIWKDDLFFGGMHDQSRGVSGNHLVCCLAWGSAAEQFKPVPWRGPERLDKPKLLPRGSRRRIIVSYVLFSVGGALCTYVAGSYAWMYGEQVKLLRQWKSQNATNQAERLTKLSIPKINLRDVVIEGISTRSLLSGPAYMTGSAAPGANGNTVIAGHRDTFFRHI